MCFENFQEVSSLVFIDKNKQDIISASKKYILNIQNTRKVLHVISEYTPRKPYAFCPL